MTQRQSLLHPDEYTTPQVTYSMVTCKVGGAHWLVKEWDEATVRLAMLLLRINNQSNHPY